MQLSLIALFALSAFAVASVIPPSNQPDVCYSGALLCCQTVQDVSEFEWDDPEGNSSLGSSAVNQKIGSKCYPVELVIGGSENPCAAAEVCCESYNPKKLLGFNCVEDFNQ